jgi:hypothetical protein
MAKIRGVHTLGWRHSGSSGGMSWESLCGIISEQVGGCASIRM